MDIEASVLEVTQCKDFEDEKTVFKDLVKFISFACMKAL